MPLGKEWTLHMQDKVKSKKIGMGRGLRRESVRLTTLLSWGRELLWGFCAFLLGQSRLALGVYPLGLGLLCASEQHTLAIFLGLIASTLFEMRDPEVYFAVYVAAGLIRLMAALLLEKTNERQKLPVGLAQRLGLTDREGCSICGGSDIGTALRETFSERVRLRMVTAALCALVVGLYRSIVGGFRYYDLFGALLLVLLAPAAVAVFSAALNGRVKHPLIREPSRALLLFALVWSAVPWSLAGMSLGCLVACFLSLWLPRTRGAVEGTVGALIAGLAYHPLYAPAFLLAALAYRLFWSMRRRGLGLAAAIAVCCLWPFYVGGVEAFLIFLPAALVGGASFGACERVFERLHRQDRDGEHERDPMRLRMEGTRRQDASDRFRGISDAFSSLSEMFYNLSDRLRRPGALDLRRICDSSFDRFCPDCPNKTVCWGLEYSATLGTVNGLISALHTKGRVTREQIPSALARRCDSVDAILETVNRECSKLTGELLCNNRTEIVAMDYEAAASIINDALEEDDGEYRFDPETEQKIAEYLGDAGVSAHSVTVYGKRRRQILVRGVQLDNAKVSLDTLRADVGELCGMRLGAPTFEVEGNVTTMTLCAGKKLAVVGAQNNVSADGGISGDTINLFSNKKDYFYALISDGMGAGREAAQTSGLCSTFLEKMLRAGNRASTSLRMLNNMMRSRGVDSTGEYSSTVDLLELDLITAEASFIKGGAAPSFIVRGRVVHRLQAGTVPIGILGTLDVESTAFPLREGDTVVMISDGIMQNDPECTWLSSYLCGVGSLTPEEIVYHICLHACESEGHDDCSAIALRIRAAQD